MTYDRGRSFIVLSHVIPPICYTCEECVDFLFVFLSLEVLSLNWAVYVAKASPVCLLFINIMCLV